MLRNNDVAQLPAEDLVVGDVVLLEQGDNVPADCRLIEAFDVRVNNATVTGESMPKARDTSPSQVEDLIRGKNILLAGTSVVSGRGKAVVFATGAHTEFGRIAHLTQAAVFPAACVRCAILPNSVCAPVAKTTALPRPETTEVPASRMFLPRIRSSTWDGLVSRAFGMDSPVTVALLTRTSKASIRRQSAGTLSPCSSRTTSPTTRSSAGNCATSLLRSIVLDAVG